jgi:peptide deformylase
MAVLPIYTDGSPILKKKAHLVKQVDDEIIKLIVDMFDTMREADGVGLAANQVGVSKRIVVIDLSGVEGMENFKPLTLINPVIVKEEDSWIMEEGCLSVPSVRDEVERPEKIKVRYKDTNFKDAELETDGFLGRVILHEIDHINGILFIDRLSTAKRKTHAKELKKIYRGEIETKYPIVPAVNAAK